MLLPPSGNRQYKGVGYFSEPLMRNSPQVRFKQRQEKVTDRCAHSLVLHISNSTTFTLNSNAQSVLLLHAYC